MSLKAVGKRNVQKPLFIKVLLLGWLSKKKKKEKKWVNIKSKLELPSYMCIW